MRTNSAVSMACTECDWGRADWDEHELLSHYILEHSWQYVWAKKTVNELRPGGTA